MPRQLNIRTIKDQLPVRYGVNPWVRITAIIAQIALSSWCIYVLFRFIRADSPWLYKFLPFLVLFVSLDTLFRHLTSLNAVIFTPECIWFRYIIKPSIAVEYDKINSLELKKALTYYLFLGFNDRKGNKRILKTQASFPKMLEIMFNISDLAPQLIMNEELNKMVKVMRDINSRRDQADDEV